MLSLLVYLIWSDISIEVMLWAVDWRMDDGRNAAPPTPPTAYMYLSSNHLLVMTSPRCGLGVWPPPAFAQGPGPGPAFCPPSFSPRRFLSHLFDPLRSLPRLLILCRPPPARQIRACAQIISCFFGLGSTLAPLIQVWGEGGVGKVVFEE